MAVWGEAWGFVGCRVRVWDRGVKGRGQPSRFGSVKVCGI